MSRAPNWAMRRQLLAQASPRYSPALHLLLPALVGLASVVAAISWLHQPSPWVWLTIPVGFIVLNAAEWRIHKSVLHRRHPLAKVLYTRHTIEHHSVFTTHAMDIHNRREWRLVLLPGYAIVLIVLLVVPLVAALAVLGAPNIGLLFGATCVGYVLLYEWLHLAYHLPQDRGIGRWRIIQVLGRHHAVHHDPRYMGKYNFNVTLPLWDWVRGTIVPPEARAAAPVPAPTVQ